MLIVGQSHANCVNAALRARAKAGTPSALRIEMIAHGAAGLPGGLVLKHAGGEETINPIVLKALKDGARQGEGRVWLVSMLAGNHAVQLGLFQGAERWRTMLPAAPRAIDEDARFVPYDVLASALERRLAAFGRFLQLVPKALVHGLVHVEAPPPVRDTGFILETMPEKIRTLAASVGLGRIDEAGIADAAHRRDVWECQSEVVARIVAAQGGTYLRPPAETVDADGFLREQYRIDPSHGNLAYGERVLQMLEKHALDAAGPATRLPETSA